MAFWVGPAAADVGFVDDEILQPSGLVPDKLRADESFNIPFNVVLRSTGELAELLVNDDYLRNYLAEYRSAALNASNNESSGKIALGYRIPWTASYKITLRGDVSEPPFLDGIMLQFLYKRTVFNKSLNAMGGLMEAMGDVEDNISLYCQYLLDGRIIPDPVYLGINCGGIPLGGPLTYGVPSEPLNVFGNNTSITSIKLNWTTPLTTDLNKESPVIFPFIDYYFYNYISVNSSRYPTFLADSAVNQIASNNTQLVQLLKPGTTYEFTVAAKNTINLEVSEQSEIGYGFTDPPITPPYVNGTDSNNLDNLAILRIPYLSQGGYTLNGSYQVDNLLNEKNLLDGTPVSTGLTIPKRNNLVPGDISNYTGKISVFDHTFNANVSSNVGGYGYTNEGRFTSPYYPITMIVTNDTEYYPDSDVDSQGFWKSFQVGIEVNRSFGGASEDISQLEMRYEPNGTTEIHTTGIITYAVDNLNIEPVLSNVQINKIYDDISNFDYISGVPTYTTNTSFRVQFNINNTHNYFIRYDKKHADITITDQFLNNISDIVEVTQDKFTTSVHNYYYPINQSYGYLTSNVTVGDGTQLLAYEGAELIQFNDFNVTINDVPAFTNNASIKVTPFNIYGVGNSTIAGVINIETGESLGLINIDTKSVVTKTMLSNSSNIIGQHVKSSIGDFPICIEELPSSSQQYDHTIDLVSDISNNHELQLSNGSFSSYAFGDGYKDYSSYYWSNSTVNSSDYTVLTTDYLYVTFKYSDRVIESKGLTLKILGEGFDEKTPSDFKLYLKVDNDNTGTQCGWLDYNKIIRTIGSRRWDKDGRSSLDFDSNGTIKHGYLPLGSTGDLYIRAGIHKDSRKRISGIEVYNIGLLDSFVYDIVNTTTTLFPNNHHY
jgi:hypothetical protein